MGQRKNRQSHERIPRTEQQRTAWKVANRRKSRNPSSPQLVGVHRAERKRDTLPRNIRRFSIRFDFRERFRKRPSSRNNGLVAEITTLTEVLPYLKKSTLNCEGVSYLLGTKHGTTIIMRMLLKKSMASSLKLQSSETLRRFATDSKTSYFWATVVLL